MPRIELFPFRNRNPVTGKWVRARYVAERHKIVARRADPPTWARGMLCNPSLAAQRRATT